MSLAFDFDCFRGFESLESAGGPQYLNHLCVLEAVPMVKSKLLSAETMSRFQKS